MKLRPIHFGLLLVALLVAAVIGTGGVATANKLITGHDIRNGSIHKADLAPGVQAKLAKKTQAGTQGPQGPVGAQGPQGDAMTLGPRFTGGGTIADIGGSFAQRATHLGVFVLPPGTWLVTASAAFDRIDDTQSSSPVLQLALRGQDASVTAWTGNYPAVGDREQSTSMSKLVISDGVHPVDVFVFGYNNDGSSAGSGNYTADVEVNTIRVE